MIEEWREVPLHPGYRVSSLGRIRGPSGRVLKAWSGRGGYQQVRAYVSGALRSRAVHSLVALAFHGERPPHHDVDHIDNDRAHNAPANLRYLSHAANVAHTKAQGRQARGEAITRARFTEADVTAIRARYIKGSRAHGLRSIAADYGCNFKVIHHIVTGATWKHVGAQ